MNSLGITGVHLICNVIFQYNYIKSLSIQVNTEPNKICNNLVTTNNCTSKFLKKGKQHQTIKKISMSI